MSKSLLLRLRHELAQVAELEKAPKMQAYMKTTMPYLGVTVPNIRKVSKKVFGGIQLPSDQVWQDLVLFLWEHAQYREEKLCAIELTADRRARPFQTMAALPMYERLIVEGAWWDYVDTIATRRFDLLLAHDERAMKKQMLLWSRSDNLWKRRSAILCQLRRKQQTDLPFLYQCIEPSLDSKEFFLRKAIGWALREYAWENPDEVLRYVHENQKRLSPLSKREALKNVERKNI